MRSLLSKTYFNNGINLFNRKFNFLKNSNKMYLNIQNNDSVKIKETQQKNFDKDYLIALSLFSLPLYGSLFGLVGMKSGFIALNGLLFQYFTLEDIHRMILRSYTMFLSLSSGMIVTQNLLKNLEEKNNSNKFDESNLIMESPKLNLLQSFAVPIISIYTNHLLFTSNMAISSFVPIAGLCYVFIYILQTTLLFKSDKGNHSTSHLATQRSFLIINTLNYFLLLIFFTYLYSLKKENTTTTTTTSNENKRQERKEPICNLFLIKDQPNRINNLISLDNIIQEDNEIILKENQLFLDIKGIDLNQIFK